MSRRSIFMILACLLSMSVLATAVAAPAASEPGATARGATKPNITAETSTIARIGERVIALEEVDRLGGRPLYDLAQQLHETRVRALYQLLSEDLLKREATARGIDVAQLLSTEVRSKVTPVSVAELEAFQRTQSREGVSDARAIKQAKMYLGMKREADAKRALVASLFDKYDVRVALEAPAPPSAEVVLGAKTPAIGLETAPVEIIVFSDYRCPYCRELSHTLDQLLASPDAQSRVIYKHLPLNDSSETLTHAALCAADQGQFEAFHSRLFETSTATADTISIATELHLDTEAFKTCLQQRPHQARLAADKQEATRLGIQGTPTLFVNGQRLRGAQSLERLRAAVSQALSEHQTTDAALGAP